MTAEGVPGGDFQEVLLNVGCQDAEQCEIAFEPFGTVHVLRRDDEFRVRIFGPGEGDIEIAYWPGGMTIWPWSGADYEVTDRAGRPVPI